MLANSRGGTLIAIAQALGVLVVFVCSVREGQLWNSAVLFAVVGASAAVQLGAIQKRLGETSINSLSGRMEIYENSIRIAADFPLWGTGPGSFPAVYFLYRESPDQTWMAMTHDDYLQTFVTFGAVGLIAIFVMLILTLLHPLFGDGVKALASFALLIGVAAMGCRIDAHFDFPLQIYLLLLLFLTLAALLTVLGLPEEL